MKSAAIYVFSMVHYCIVLIANYGMDLLLWGDPLLGIFDPPVVDTLLFTLTLNPFADDAVDMFVDSDGYANHVVPLPAAFWLLGSGLIGLIGVAIRSKQRNP